MTTALEFLNVTSQDTEKPNIKADPATGMDQLQTRLAEAAAHRGAKKL